MDPLKQYEIAFVGLKTGIHPFTFEVDEVFFESFSGTLVKNAKCKVDVKLDKRSTFFLLHFYFEGKVHLPCDRCGSELDYPLDNEYTIVVKFDEHRDEEKDDSNADVIYISHHDSVLNVAQLIYEFISLSIPLNHINCDNLKENKPCDKDVLDRLKKNAALKHEADHRWDNLTNIKFN